MRNNQAKILFLTIVITFLVTMSSALLIVCIVNMPESKAETKLVKDNEKKEKRIGNENVVIFGDSITELYPVSEIYGDMPVLKSGVSGYKTQDLLDRMDKMLYQYNPTKVILLIGINDFMPDKSEENQEYIIKNIKKIIAEIKKNRPMAKIYLESIYPINTELKKTLAEPGDNEIIKSINERLKEYCDTDDVVYINMFDELTDRDGELDSTYTNDGIHPNTMGYAKITRVLLPYINE